MWLKIDKHSIRTPSWVSRFHLTFPFLCMKKDRPTLSCKVVHPQLIYRDKSPYERFHEVLQHILKWIWLQTGHEPLTEGHLRSYWRRLANHFRVRLDSSYVLLQTLQTNSYKFFLEKIDFNYKIYTNSESGLIFRI